MILFYVDESGTGLGDPKSRYFVLGSIAIRAEDLHEINQACVDLKRRLVTYMKPEDWEIKGRDLRRGVKTFVGWSWEKRSSTFIEIARMIERFRCEIYAIQVDKLSLPQGIESEPQLYRLGLWKLLEELDDRLEILHENGIMLLDMRSDMHTTVQDRRVVDAYCDWADQRTRLSRFCELPLFGNSTFYSGLQLADFVCYLIDFDTNEKHQETRRNTMQTALEILTPSIHLVRIP